MADPYAPAPPKPVSAPMAPQPNAFDRARARTTQRFDTQAQDQGEAMKRRFAAMGTMNSGHALKMQDQQAADIAGQREDALLNLELPEAQQQFQATEAQKGRDFQGGQFDQTLQFQKDQFKDQFGLARDQFGVDAASKMGGLDLARREMGLKQAEQEYNIAQSIADKGYGIEFRGYLPSYARDTAGNVINPDGVKSGEIPGYSSGGAGQPSYFDSPEYQAMIRRAKEEADKKKREGPGGGG